MTTSVDQNMMILMDIYQGDELIMSKEKLLQIDTVEMVSFEGIVMSEKESIYSLNDFPITLYYYAASLAGEDDISVTARIIPVEQKSEYLPQCITVWVNDITKEIQYKYIA